MGCSSAWLSDEKAARLPWPLPLSELPIKLLSWEMLFSILDRLLPPPPPPPVMAAGEVVAAFVAVDIGVVFVPAYKSHM